MKKLLFFNIFCSFVFESYIIKLYFSKITKRLSVAASLCSDENSFSQFGTIPEGFLTSSATHKFICPSCSKSYRHKFHLMRHLKYECNVEPKFQCVGCGYKFKHNYVLQRHIQSMSCKGLKL